jgi:hypothetical protein
LEANQLQRLVARKPEELSTLDAEQSELRTHVVERRRLALLAHVPN